MARAMCYRCFWPQSLCWCPSLRPMPTRTHFAFLMHPKEFKQEKAATGRLTHLCLPNSSLHMGVSFDGDASVQRLLCDPRHHAVLLYPGPGAVNLSAFAGRSAEPTAGQAAFAASLEGRTLLVVLLDATWSCARKMLRLSPSLQRLPRVMFTPSGPSRYTIKQQPQEGCLSTLEAVHEVLTVLDRAGLDDYALPGQLLDVFGRMQDFQMRCARDPSRPGYRRQPYSDPGSRVTSARSGRSRRENYLRTPARPQDGTAAGAVLLA